MANKTKIAALALAALLGLSGTALAQSADTATAGTSSGGEGQSFGNLPLTGFAYNDGSR